MYDDRVSVTAPYWQRDAQARRSIEVFELAWRGVDRVTPAGIYGPQLDREIRLPEDSGEVLSVYGRVVGSLAGLAKAAGSGRSGSGGRHGGSSGGGGNRLVKGVRCGGLTPNALKSIPKLIDFSGTG